MFARLTATSAGSGAPVDARWIDPMTDRGASDLDDAFPTAAAGVSGMRFLRACVRSSKEQAWVAP